MLSEGADTHHECLTCKQPRLRSSFGRHRGWADGRDRHCKECRAVQRRESAGFSRTVCWLAKKCDTCGFEKQRSEFYRNDSRFDGRESVCKSCRAKRKQERLKASPSQYEAHRERENSRRRTPEYRAAAAQRQREARQVPQARIYKQMGERLRRALRGTKAGRSWPDLVGYTPEQLRDHLERQFTEGMTWDRFLAGEIHIDHIVPQSSFRYSSTECPEFRACWSLSNLRPMWADKNIAKGGRVETLI